jgi:hypothetical protein
MLDSATTQKIENFVALRPRSLLEIAQHIGKSWKTTDRYIEHITKEFGTVTTHTFRQGTRGALKIVYWASTDKKSQTVAQQQLTETIYAGKTKQDFSGFDIFQYVPDKNKTAIMEYQKEESLTNIKEFIDLLKTAKKQILSFSGNLSYINLKNKEVDVCSAFEDLHKKGISIKVLCRVDFEGKENIQNLLNLNFKHGKELIEIHHREHPLRAIIIDNTLFRIKEIKLPTGKQKELDKQLYLFYTIKDKEWVQWATRLFWNLFNASIDANKRLEEMKKIEKK